MTQPINQGHLILSDQGPKIGKYIQQVLSSGTPTETGLYLICEETDGGFIAHLIGLIGQSLDQSNLPKQIFVIRSSPFQQVYDYTFGYVYEDSALLMGVGENQQAMRRVAKLAQQFPELLKNLKY